MKTQTGKELLKLVDKWLKKEGNTESRLAVRCGYASSTTVTNWFKRGYVPSLQLATVTRIMKESK